MRGRMGRSVKHLVQQFMYEGFFFLFLAFLWNTTLMWWCAHPAAAFNAHFMLCGFSSCWVENNFFFQRQVLHLSICFYLRRNNFNWQGWPFRECMACAWPPLLSLKVSTFIPGPVLAKCFVPPQLWPQMCNSVPCPLMILLTYCVPAHYTLP